MISLRSIPFRQMARRPYTTEPARPPRIGVRSTFFGFFLGLTTAGAIGYSYLLNDINHANLVLVQDVRELSKTVAKIKNYMTVMETVEKDIKALKETSAEKTVVERVRRELLNSIDEVVTGHLEVKTKLWEVEQDILKAKEGIVPK